MHKNWNFTVIVYANHTNESYTGCFSIKVCALCWSL